VDPEVVTQFNCLQRTGNFCPSASNGSTTMSSSTTAAPTVSSSSTSAPPMSAQTTEQREAADAVFALMGMPEDDLGSLGNLSPSRRDPLPLTLASHR